MVDFLTTSRYYVGLGINDLQILRVCHATVLQAIPICMPHCSIWGLYNSEFVVSVGLCNDASLVVYRDSFKITSGCWLCGRGCGGAIAVACMGICIQRSPRTTVWHAYRNRFLIPSHDILVVRGLLLKTSPHTNEESFYAFSILRKHPTHCTTSNADDKCC